MLAAVGTHLVRLTSPEVYYCGGFASSTFWGWSADWAIRLSTECLFCFDKLGNFLTLSAPILQFYGAINRPMNGMRPRMMLIRLVRTKVITAESNIVAGVEK